MNGKTTSGDGSSKINAYKKLSTTNIVSWQSVNKCETKQKSQELENDKYAQKNNTSKPITSFVRSENSNKQSVWRLLKIDDVKKNWLKKNDKNERN